MATKVNSIRVSYVGSVLATFADWSCNRMEIAREAVEAKTIPHPRVSEIGVGALRTKPDSIAS